MRGSARCTGSSGLGDTATYIPAGGGPVREAMPASRTVRVSCAARALRRACTERAQACLRAADLAENRPRLDHAITPLTMGVEGAKGVLGERIGGAFASQFPCVVRGFVP
ncbi:hypothetical protein GCM10010121_062850 [Streptomyces brasiliensis]|uniref:Uncharacterized protein n=1 Tax=Streptomyces brasiliensis TaxID=1954 RepID=A0A917L6M2_9ACTN|nr:hypothetical protein GCM10010121_062850 [Streptomyces brasiliensis]